MEIAYSTGYDLTGHRILFYDGNTGTVYKTTDVENDLSVTNVDPSGSFSFSAYTVYSFNSQVQNGPDGIALVDGNNNVLDFIAYGSQFTATSGPAAGLPPTLIGVQEPGNTNPAFSLQLSGTGYRASDFTWQPPQLATPGLPNTGQEINCAR